MCVREGADSIMVIGHCLPSCSYTNTIRKIIKDTSSQRVRDTYYVCERERECECVGEKEIAR